MNASDILNALACGASRCACAAAARSDKGLTHCPAHTDSNPSLNVTDTDEEPLVYCHAGCPQTRVINVLRERGLWSSPRDERGRDGPVHGRRIIATYPYTDERGALLFQVLRFEPKRFVQRRPDGSGGFIYNLEGVRRVLYHLPEVLAAAWQGSRVCVVEGEKDADALDALGLCATTSPGGAGKWRDDYADYLRGAEVVVIADKDEPGRAHARQVAESLAGKAKAIKVIEL